MYSKEWIRKYAGNQAQLFGIKSYTFDEGREKGVKAFEIDTGSGLRFTVLPDRCMDISYAQFKGKNLAYITKSGIVSPCYYDPQGQEWLRNFGGGLLATCGLTQVGDPERDGGWDLGLHGRIGNIPAKEICHRGEWNGDTYTMELSGTMQEAVLYEEFLELRRKITAIAGENIIQIDDVIENKGSRDENLMMLYHCNFGYPLLDGDTRFLADIKKAETGTLHGSWRGIEPGRYSEPDTQGGTALYFYDLQPDQNGNVTVWLKNRAVGIGIWMKYDKQALPCFAHWKNNAFGDYVTGLEPGTALPVGRKNNLERGTFRKIAPGEKVKISLEIGVFEGE